MIIFQDGTRFRDSTLDPGWSWEAWEGYRIFYELLKKILASKYAILLFQRKIISLSFTNLLQYITRG